MSYPSTERVIEFANWLKSHYPEWADIIPLLMKDEKDRRDALRPKRKRGIHVKLLGGRVSAELDQDAVKDLMEGRE